VSTPTTPVTATTSEHTSADAARDRAASLRGALAYDGRPGRLPAALGALTVLVLLAAPFLLNAYQVSMLARVLVYGLLAISATLLTGVTGLPTLGQAAYFGVGAYTAALVAKHVTALGPVQVVAAAATAAVVALLTGTLAARARGVPFLMITLAIGEIAYSGAASWDSITHGTDGLSGIPRVVPLPGLPELRLDGLVYYYALAVFAAVYLLVRALLRSPVGLVLRGLRDNEARLRAIGYSSGGYVLFSFTAAGAVAGAAGALLVSVQRFVSPGDMGFSVAAIALLAAIIGGVGSLPGAVVGAALVVLARDYIGAGLRGHGPTLVGAMFVLVVYLLPGGLAAIKVPGRLAGRFSGRELRQRRREQA
jgi:branched-chain amino acid transport system permease protein